jgi:hypothetical protein
VGIKAVKNLESKGSRSYLQCTIVAKYWKQELATGGSGSPSKDGNNLGKHRVM